VFLAGRKPGLFLKSMELIMIRFDIHTTETAAPAAAKLLGHAEQAYGFVPNLLGAFAESPATLKGYLALSKIFDESSFDPAERQVILLAASRFGECHYCVAAHSVAANMQGVPASVVDAIRNDRPIADEKLETLRDFTTAVVEKRGRVTGVDVDEFIAAGYSRAQVLEVILAVGLKTISNYVNHVVDTPVDAAFAPREWQPAA
jgi:uncharacterized peroxidase-related enzyme